MKEFGPFLFLLGSLEKLKIKAPEFESLGRHKAVVYTTFRSDFLQIFSVHQFSYIVVMQTLYWFCMRNAQEEKPFQHLGTVTKLFQTKIGRFILFFMP